jgi:GNAT superfamily N-acetyltransferase
MPVDETITLKSLAREELESAHGLSRAVAWPHRLEDWQVMFELGRGFAAVDRDGALQGVAMWWPQGDDFATLGMVIVSPVLQKSGIGRRLMAAIMEAAENRRVQLNATVAGLRLYESFGFVDVGGIHQHNGTLLPSVSAVTGGTAVRALSESDHDALLSLDRRATGVDRSGVLEVLLPLSEVYALDGADGLAGFLLVRDFGRGKLLGPLVAENEENALALLSHAAVRTGGFLRADIPDDAALLAEWLEGAGLPRVGAVRTMLRGAKVPQPGTARIFGLASQALG